MTPIHKRITMVSDLPFLLPSSERSFPSLGLCVLRFLNHSFLFSSVGDKVSCILGYPETHLITGDNHESLILLLPPLKYWGYGHEPVRPYFCVNVLHRKDFLRVKVSLHMK